LTKPSRALGRIGKRGNVGCGKVLYCVSNSSDGELILMIVFKGIESIGLLSVWVLEPRLPELLLGLREKGYVTGRVRPKGLGGYEVTPVEPNVVAIKGLTRVGYDQGRRAVIIEGPNPSELHSVFSEVEDVLRDAGSDPARGVLFYELQVRARASGGKWALKKAVGAKDLLGTDLLAVPVSFVSLNGDPNSLKWLHLEVRPLWTSWPEERVRYEVTLVCRDNRDKLLNMLQGISDILKGILERIQSELAIST